MSDTTERPLEDGWLPDTPVEDSLLRRFAFNQAEMNELVAEECGGRSHRTDSVSCADALSPVGFLNQAVLLRPVGRTDDPVLDEIDDFYRSSGRASTVLSIAPTPPLQARGWELVGHPTFVARAPGAVPGHERPGVRVRDVHSLEDVGIFERVLVEGYPMPEGAGEPPGTFFPPGVVDRGLRLRLGVIDGEPVATGAVYAAHGVTNLCGAATLPDARRRGVWQALVWSRVAEAPDQPAVAFTSDYSRPGFERMGFLPILRCTLWMLTG
jgi:hypothetical protein